MELVKEVMEEPQRWAISFNHRSQISNDTDKMFYIKVAVSEETKCSWILKA